MRDDEEETPAAAPAEGSPAGSGEALRLSDPDNAALLAAICDAVAVRRRFQFFSWSQGRLQRLLPHGILVCGLPRGNGAGMFYDYFHNVPLPSSSLARLCNPRDGVAPRLLEAWREGGSEPMAVCGERALHLAILGDLEELGMGATVAHGIPFEQSNVGAHGFFAFVSLRTRPTDRETFLAAMLVPHVFSAYCRALARDRVAPRPEPEAGEGTLSEREIEILHWVREGKSNHEIGMVLSISPLTVKNHVQRILRKLQASNRTQAVTKAISMRLLHGSGRHGEALGAGALET